MQYESILKMNFDDGKTHDLAEIYADILTIEDDTYIKELLDLPQMNTIIMLNGIWYMEDWDGKKSTKETVVEAGVYDGDNIIYLDGNYYSSYHDSDNYWEITNITPTRHTRHYHMGHTDYTDYIR